jgi:hypothetical protein
VWVTDERGKDPRFDFFLGPTVRPAYDGGGPTVCMEDPRFPLPRRGGEDPRAIIRFPGSAEEDPRFLVFGKDKKNYQVRWEDPRFLLLASGRTHELS